jgi:hypothetical protein
MIAQLVHTLPDLSIGQAIIALMSVVVLALSALDAGT